MAEVVPDNSFANNLTTFQVQPVLALNGPEFGKLFQANLLEERLALLALEDQSLSRCLGLIDRVSSVVPSRSLREWYGANLTKAWEELKQLEGLIRNCSDAFLDQQSWHSLCTQANKQTIDILENVQEMQSKLERMGDAPFALELTNELSKLSHCASSMYKEFLNTPCRLNLKYFSQIMPGDILQQNRVSSLVLGENRNIRYPFEAPVLNIGGNGSYYAASLNISKLISSGSVRHVERSARPCCYYAVEIASDKRALSTNALVDLRVGDIVEELANGADQKFGRHRRFEVLRYELDAMSVLFHEGEFGAVRLLESTPLPKLIELFSKGANPASEVLIKFRAAVRPDSELPILERRKSMLIGANFSGSDNVQAIRVIDRNEISTPRALSQAELRLPSSLQLDLSLGWKGAPELHTEAFLRLRNTLQQDLKAQEVNGQNKADPYFAQILATNIWKKVDEIFKGNSNVHRGEPWVVVPNMRIASIQVGDMIMHSDGSSEMILGVTKGPDQNYFIESLLSVDTCEIKIAHLRDSLEFFPGDTLSVLRKIRSSRVPTTDKDSAPTFLTLVPEVKKALQHDNLRVVDQLLGLINNTLNFEMQKHADYLARERRFLLSVREQASTADVRAGLANQDRVPDWRYEQLITAKDDLVKAINAFRHEFEGLCLYAEHMSPELEVDTLHSSLTEEPRSPNSIALMICELALNLVEKHTSALSQSTGRNCPAHQQLQALSRAAREILALIQQDHFVIEQLREDYKGRALGAVQALAGRTIVEAAPNQEYFNKLSQLTSIYYQPENIATQGIVVSNHPPSRFEEYATKGARFFSYLEGGELKGFLIAFPPEKVRNIAPEVETRYSTRGKLWYLHLVVVHPEARGAHRFLHNNWRLMAMGEADGAVARVHRANLRSWQAHLESQGWKINTPDTTIFAPAGQPEKAALFIGMQLDFRNCCLDFSTDRSALIKAIKDGSLRGVIRA